MYTIGNDYGYSDRLYNMQWDYPYILNVSENPETHVMPEPAPVAAPKDETGQNLSENYTEAVNQNAQAVNPATNMGFTPTFLDSTIPGWTNYKKYIIPALIALAAVMLYMKFKK